jgi:uncharacterized protein involved in exopolysaccharide biosynthesis
MGVVDSLDLTNRWEIDRESALGILQKMVRKENIRGTDLHVITVRHTNREDARDIAAEVAKAYVNSKNVTASDKVEGKLSELRKAVREQEEKVREARNTLTELSRTMDLSKEMDATEAQSYTEAKRDFETALALLEQMELKLLSSTIDAQLREGTIVIHDYPVISHVPVSPNVTLNLVIGAVGGLLISPFLALPLMWVLSRGDATRG